MEVGELHLGTGTTSTDFHKEGKWPSLREALNIAARGSEIIGANSFNNQLGMIILIDGLSGEIEFFSIL